MLILMKFYPHILLTRHKNKNLLENVTVRFLGILDDDSWLFNNAYLKKWALESILIPTRRIIIIQYALENSTDNSNNFSNYSN